MYWFAFWREIAVYCNEQARKEKSDFRFHLWNRTSLTNITKSVTLRLFQTLFMSEAIERIEKVIESREILVEALGEETAEKKRQEKIAEFAILPTIEEFRLSTRKWFLEKGVSVRFFTKPWVRSLDDAQGQTDLREEMEKAYSLCQKGRRYHAENRAVFAPPADNH